MQRMYLYLFTKHKSCTCHTLVNISLRSAPRSRKISQSQQRCPPAPPACVVITAAAAGPPCAASPLPGPPPSRPGPPPWSQISLWWKGLSTTYYENPWAYYLLFISNPQIYDVHLKSRCTLTYVLHLSKRNFHFMAVRSSSFKLVNSLVYNRWSIEQRSVILLMFNRFVSVLSSWDTVLTVQPRMLSATGLLRLQACRVPVWSVRSTGRSKPVVADRGWSLPAHNVLVQLATSSVTRNLHLELRSRNCLSRIADKINHVLQRIQIFEAGHRGCEGRSRICLIMHQLDALGWTCHRVLMTLETEESMSSRDRKLYVMPKKAASGFSWAFCFSWLTVYTSVMESTAETEAAAHWRNAGSLFTRRHIVLW